MAPRISAAGADPGDKGIDLHARLLDQLATGGLLVTLHVQRVAELVGPEQPREEGLRVRALLRLAHAGHPVDRAAFLVLALTADIAGTRNPHGLIGTVGGLDASQHLIIGGGADGVEVAHLADHAPHHVRIIDDRFGGDLPGHDGDAGGDHRLAARPWQQLNDLIGAADGKKFNLLAQRITLDLLLQHANVQLREFSSRYRLERLGESLNLVIVDQHLGDERRSVHSLSGGETFLASLALALGLASLTSNRVRIESLFIDEGFGSLDEETLETAMNALGHLQSQGRRVGIITHVERMKDAIPVQVRVQRASSGTSRIVLPRSQTSAEH